MFRVAIHPDNYGEGDSSSPGWKQHLIERGHQVVDVDVFQPDILKQLQGCNGFMWRHAHFGNMQAIARRLLPVVERTLGLVVYPDQNTCWHYDDKIAQWYLLEAAGIPMPQTWVFYRMADALQWLQAAEFPLVLKLTAGASSEHVKLIRTMEEAEYWVAALFGNGVYNLNRRDERRWGIARRIRAAAKAILLGRPPWEPPHGPGRVLHRDYIYLQEFLPQNPFDTRITVIGNRAFGFRRWNRANDFRASGSGKLDYDVQSIDLEFVRLAFRVARILQTQSLAIDGLYRRRRPVIGEISYTYINRAVQDCPGHWVLTDTDELHWVAGNLPPEEAQVVDFLARLERQNVSPSSPSVSEH